MKKRVISFILALAMVCSLLPGISIGAAAAQTDSYTYNSYISNLPWCWNPHTWEANSASTVMRYLETPLVSMEIADSKNGVYQWAYLAAESVTDVTAQHQDDLVKYGADSADATSGYVFDIALNPDMKWQDGTPINADTYVYSMQQLLDPDLENYRANNYLSGNAAIAGAYDYFYSNTEGYYVPYTNVYSSLDEAMAATEVYINVWHFWGAEGYIDAEGNECAQYISITDETEYSADGQGNDAFSGAALYRDYGSYFEPGTGYDSYVVVYQKNENMGIAYDTVGLYKVDDYTIRYVTQSYIDMSYMLTSLTSNWIVHEELYESCKASGAYGTSVETTMSYGPYMLETADPNSQFVLVQNPNHYEYTANADGSLSSVTEFLVDGQHVSQWQTTKIVLSIMDDASAKAAFLAGQLDEWVPTRDDLVTYAASDRLYKADETYTMSLFFNTDLEALQAMDAGETEYMQTNAVVLSNDNFRKAFSLAIDRSDWVTVTSGYKPAYGLMNNLYYYDIYNDPSSSYRYSDQAMAAMCDFYGVSYTADTLRSAYDSITGYDLAQAKALMAQACRELVEAGLYTEGEEIFIQMGWSSGAMTDAIRAQGAKLTAYLNAAAEGSGFGTITLNPLGYSSPYWDVPDGQLPIGYGAWGGAAFYPFRNMQVYCDAESYAIHEAGCWDPAAEELTLTVNGEDVTMTWQEWSRACTSGSYRKADADTKLAITAALETGFLGKYYRIPLAGSTVCSMLSHKLDYYTQEYNIMYGFGGMRLMRYNYTDAQWEAYIANNELDYGATELPTTPTESTEATEPVEPTEPTEPVAPPALTGDYTYNTYTEVLAENWNPHTWDTSSDSTVIDLLTTPLVDMTVADSENGIYQWIYLAAQSVTDVTAQHQDDLVKYGASATDATSGYVFDIALNPDMKWQDGTPINADTYVYSMERLLNPDLQNYRANTYYSGEAAIAGAEGYFYSGRETALDNGLTATYTMSDLVLGEDGVYTTPAGGRVYIPTGESIAYLGGSLGEYVEAYGSDYFDIEAYAALVALADENGNVTLTEESAALLLAVISNPNWGEGEGYEPNYLKYVVAYPVVGYDTVGLYKVDDYTIRYVTQNHLDINYLLTSLTSNWLVYESLYETGSYGNAVSNTMSYGPYQLSYISGTQMVFTQNPNHYEYTVNADGTLSSVTEFLVDGQQVNQWQTQNYVISVMGQEEAKSAFLNGQLDEWTPSSDDLVTYAASDRLYKADETYTMSFFLNTNLEALKSMDNAEEFTNKNSVVMSNENFRKAFSLAIDRSDWVTATSGYKPAFTLMNSLYYYDIYNNPDSSYRNSKQAMAAFCDLYGVSYTDETLKEDYASITGYDLAQAKALMAQACDELVEAGLYTEGDSITIRIAYTMGTLTAAHEAQIAKLNAYINAAAEGSGFGPITLVGDSGFNTYGAVADGTHAIGYGAWGGAPFYPFRMMQVYCAPDMYFLHEGNCWDPASETLTLTVNGEDVTMTWQDWSMACTSGAYRDADFDTKLTITAALEAGFLGKYYRIPLASSTSCTMLSYQADYYTDYYNAMYGFGGLRLVRYNYTDSAWAEYVASGVLDYGTSGGSGEEEDPVADAEFVGHSLSLNGDIGVNFYTTLSDAVLADENAHIEFTMNGMTCGYSLADALVSTADDGTVRYRFSYAVPAKSMADVITAQMCVSEGFVGESKTYSVAQYYTDICEQFDREEKAELFALIESMLNYGAAAQEYFGYNTDNLANAAVSTAIPDAVDASAYAPVISDYDDNLSYAGMSLVLESNTVLRVFFRPVSGADISGYTFTVNGQTVTPVQRGNLWYIELANIAAKDLDTACTFTAGDVTVECSALSYVCSVLNKADALDEKLVAVCKALYAYNEAANAYFSN